MSEEKQLGDGSVVETAHVVLTDTGRSKAEAFRSTHKTQVLTILLTDLENSTAQQSELGNVRAFEITAEHRQVFRDLLANFDGEEVETAGDSFLIVFAAPSEGVRFALHMQAAMRQARETTPELPRVRCGLHQGQIVVERHERSVTGKAMDIYGIQISIAARITDLAGGGQIFCTRNVGDDARAILRADDLAGLEEVTWRNHGPYGFKGVENTYEVCEVGEGPHAPLEAPPATLKSWPATHGEEIPGWRPSVGIVVPETNWRLEEKLGEGQFGEVWMAYNASNKARQVFKFTFKRTQVSALKREARLLHRLKEYRHPALVEVYDVTEGDRPPHYLEMEYVDGPTMAEWIAADPPLEHRIELIGRVAEVLEVAHQSRIYHRDIKPANILLQRREDGSVLPKLADFGVGAAEDADLLKTLYASKTEHRAGTWDYIAPELKAEAMTEDGHRPRATAQSDLYALGLTLYQLVTGDLQSLPGPGWEGNIPTDELREDIAACMATDPKQRPASGSELAQQLRQHAQRAQARRIQRLRRTVFVAAAVALIALGIAAFSGYQWQQAQEQRRVAEGERGRAEEQRERADTEREEARRQLYHSSILQVSTHLDNRRFDLARSVLWQAPVEHSGWEWGYLAQQLEPSLSVLEGHEDSVLAASFSPDGSRIATVSRDRTARVWDARTGQEMLVLEGHEDSVLTASFSPDGAHVAATASDGTARVWDADSGKELKVLRGHEGAIHSAKFSPESRRIVTASNDGTARVWDTDTGAELKVLEGHENQLRSAEFSPDGRRIVTASLDRTARVWDADTGAALHTLEGHDDGVRSAIFSPDGRRIVTASWDRTARVWDADTGEEVLKLEDHENSAKTASFSPDGDRIITVSEDGAARVWGAESGQEMHMLELPGMHATFSPDGLRIVTASEDGTARVWDAGTGQNIRILEGHQRKVLHAAFSPESARIITASEDGTARVWDTDTGEEILKLEGHERSVFHASFSSDGAHIVTASDDNTTRVWNAQTGHEMHILKGHDGAQGNPSFSPDGARIVTTAWDYAARVWDTETGEEILVLKGHGEFGITLTITTRMPACFSPDGAHVVTAAWDGTARVWDAQSGCEIHVLKLHQFDVLHVSYSPDGTRIIAPSRANTARVWDAQTGQELHVLEGHEAYVSHASFSQDGTRIVTASGNGTARVWDADTGTQLQILNGHEGKIGFASFSVDGSRILTTSHRNTRIWTAAPWRLEDLPPVEGVFDSREEERKARFFEWKQQEYQRWLEERRESP